MSEHMNPSTIHIKQNSFWQWWDQLPKWKYLNLSMMRMAFYAGYEAALKESEGK